MQLTEKKDAEMDSKSVASKITVVSIFFIALAFVVLSFGLSSISKVGTFAILIGSAILGTGYYHIIHVLPRMARDVKTGIAEDSVNRANMQATRVSSWLVIIGLVIILLGLLELMGVIPTLT